MSKPKPLEQTRDYQESPSHYYILTPLEENFKPPYGANGFTGAQNGVQKKRKRVDDDFYASRGLWNDIKTLRWMRVPSSSFKLLMTPIVLHLMWTVCTNKPSPFEPLFFISHRVPESSPDDPRYAKGWLDIAFILYHLIVFSFVRQLFVLKMAIPFARWMGVKRSKFDRFGEQAYAIAYYGTMGVWGLIIMKTLPTWWYRAEYFWIDYPHWDMKAALKRYYLMHASYWTHQLIVLVLKIEKPRKDFAELTAHHIVTIWLIGWSYGVNLTLIGNAVYASMDIPDVIFAFSKLFNYLGYTMAKNFSTAIFFLTWTYFRHYLNIKILWSVWAEFDLMPETSKMWSPPDGVWMVWWMKYQIFVPLFLLQLLNLFWFYLILRVVHRTLIQKQDVDDIRSDEEGEGEKEE